MPVPPLPQLLVAVILSERVLRPDDVLDLLGISAGVVAPPGTRLPFTAEIVFFMRLAANEFSDAGKLTLQCPGLGIDESVTLAPRRRYADTPMDLLTPLTIQVATPGLHWLEVRFGERLLTRVPIRVEVPPNLA